MTMMRRIAAAVARAPSLESRGGGRLCPAPCLITRGFSDSTEGGETKTGTVKVFQYQKAYGFIVPDGVDRINHTNNELFFFHRADIKLADSGTDGEKYYPSLSRGQRVEFTADAPDEGKESPRARNITLEGGKIVPPFNDGYLENFTRVQKARFGDEVFEIMSTSIDQEEMESRIVEAFDGVKARIERQEGRVKRSKDGYE
mmetsp:Transcript_19322/g.45224  ORF Transcript_19322/g.45224 Transcript_19322/m.45224 type:complete len:201 (-) Transcript_19322:1146-1748(-)